MMKRLSRKPLHLDSSTIRQLDLAQVGGGSPHSAVFKCSVTKTPNCSLNGDCTGIITWDGNC